MGAPTPNGHTLDLSGTLTGSGAEQVEVVFTHNVLGYRAGTRTLVPVDTPELAECLAYDFVRLVIDGEEQLPPYSSPAEARAGCATCGGWQVAYFVPNPVGILALKTSPTEPVYKDLLRRTLRVDAAAKTLAPVDTGRLRGSIRFAIATEGGNLVGYVGTDVRYAKFVHEGTKGGTVIRPINKRALYWPGADHPIGSVTRGATRAQPFLREALAAAN